MEKNEWNKLQLDLYEKLKNNSSDISIKEVLSIYQTDLEVWQEFMSILRDSNNEFDVFVSVDKIREDGNYLIIMIGVYEYLVIDMNNKKVLDKKEVEYHLDKKYFVDNYGDKNDDFDYYYFYDECNIDLLLEFYNKNKVILYKDNSINYEYKDETGVVGINYNLASKDITLYFHGFFGDDILVNYIHFDSDLNPTGVSNPTGNMDELRVIANDLKNITVSKKMLGEKVKELKLD